MNLVYAQNLVNVDFSEFQNQSVGVERVDQKIEGCRTSDGGSYPGVVNFNADLGTLSLVSNDNTKQVSLDVRLSYYGAILAPACINYSQRYIDSSCMYQYKNVDSLDSRDKYTFNYSCRNIPMRVLLGSKKNKNPNSVYTELLNFDWKLKYEDFSTDNIKKFSGDIKLVIEQNFKEPYRAFQNYINTGNLEGATGGPLKNLSFNVGFKNKNTNEIIWKTLNFIFTADPNVFNSQYIDNVSDLSNLLFLGNDLSSAVIPIDVIAKRAFCVKEFIPPPSTPMHYNLKCSSEYYNLSNFETLLDTKSVIFGLNFVGYIQHFDYPALIPEFKGFDLKKFQLKSVCGENTPLGAFQKMVREGTAMRQTDAGIGESPFDSSCKKYALSADGVTRDFSKYKGKKFYCDWNWEESYLTNYQYTRYNLSAKGCLLTAMANAATAINFASGENTFVTPIDINQWANVNNKFDNSNKTDPGNITPLLISNFDDNVKSKKTLATIDNLLDVIDSCSIPTAQVKNGQSFHWIVPYDYIENPDNTYTINIWDPGYKSRTTLDSYDNYVRQLFVFEKDGE